MKGREGERRERIWAGVTVKGNVILRRTVLDRSRPSTLFRLASPPLRSPQGDTSVQSQSTELLRLTWSCVESACEKGDDQWRLRVYRSRAWPGGATGDLTIEVNVKLNQAM